MAQYAEDAKETDRPWERWQSRGKEAHDRMPWRTMYGHPKWQDSRDYRRKPFQVQVAGEVFDDVVLDNRVDLEREFYMINREVSNSSPVYSVSARKARFIADSTFREGRVHTTYEGALRHLEALTPKVL
jgi:hypothetical protein